MDAYLVAKTVHILSATVLFGTGLGIAFFFLMGMRSGDAAGAAARLFAFSYGDGFKFWTAPAIAGHRLALVEQFAP